MIRSEVVLKTLKGLPISQRSGQSEGIFKFLEKLSSKVGTLPFEGYQAFHGSFAG